MPARKNLERELAEKMILEGKGSTEITKELCVSKSLVCGIANSLGIKMPRPGCKKPTPMQRMTCDNCVEEFYRPEREHRANRARESRRRNVPVGKIGTFCSRKCFRDHQGWSAKELAYLRANYMRFTHKQMAVRLSRNKPAVSQMCHAMQLAKLSRRWGASDLAELMELRQNGWTVRECAVKYGVTTDNIFNTLRHYGLTRPKNKLTFEQRKRIRRLHRRGHSDVVISEKVGVHVSMVVRYRKKHGLPSQLTLGRLNRRCFGPRKRRASKVPILLTESQLLDLATSAVSTFKDGDEYLAVVWEAMRDANAGGESNSEKLIECGIAAVRKFRRDTTSFLSLDGFTDEDGKKFEVSKDHRFQS